VHYLDIWIKVDLLWWHLLYYVNLLLNMFRMLVHPSSGACDYLVRYCVGCIVLTWVVLVLCSGIGCWWCGVPVQAEPLLYVLIYLSSGKCYTYIMCPVCLWVSVFLQACGVLWLLNIFVCGMFWCFMHLYWSLYAWAVRTWLEACWCYVAGLAVGDVVSECRLNHYCGSACTRTPHHQQPIPLHNTNTPQVSTIQPTQ